MTGSYVNMKVKDKEVLATKDVINNVDWKSRHKSNKPLVRRSKGVLTREKILESAILELSQSGIKGTTHRAIAHRAQLQLSLTTYYFRDIQELVHHAFMLNAAKLLMDKEVMFEKIFILLNAFKKADLRKSVVKDILYLQLVDLFVDYIAHTASKLAEASKVERLMFTERQFCEKLDKVTKEYELSLLLPYKNLCFYFDKKNTGVNTYLLHSLISNIQYSVCAQFQEKIDRDFINQNVKKILAIIMKIKH
jgi:AcrR family transcriptional regulator